MLNLIKIEDIDIDRYLKNGAGFWIDGMCCIDDCEQVIIRGRVGTYLAPATEFTYAGPSPKLLLAIGGEAETERQKLAKQLKIGLTAAEYVLCFRSMKHWSEALETKLIELVEKDFYPDLGSFGLSKEQKAQDYWNRCKKSRNLKNEEDI